MKTGKTNRDYPFHYAEKKHLKLNDLLSTCRAEDIYRTALYKEDIPAYPHPEFHVSHLKHDTNGEALKGIHEDSGFRGRSSDFQLPVPVLWWNLVVGPDEVSAAETRLLESTYPDRTEEQVQNQQSFLKTFATSPAFSETSRLGPYRFTFPVQELLTAYSKQFCSGAEPIMRVWSTELYKAEVQYVVLVHGPDTEQQFSRFPLLTDDPNAICSFRDGCFVWRSQAMCKTHWYELLQRPDEKQMEAQELNSHEFYVWDQVAIALHIPDQVLTFDGIRLRENLKFCELDNVKYSRLPADDYSEAEELVNELWPDHPSPLKEPKS